MKFELSMQKLSGVVTETVSASEIYLFVESKQGFTQWIKKLIKRGGFVEGEFYN